MVFLKMKRFLLTFKVDTLDVLIQRHISLRTQMKYNDCISRFETKLIGAIH